MALMTETDPATETIAALARAAAASAPAALQSLREAGLSAFTRLGFPTTRLEDWRFTNTQRIAATPYRPPATGTEPTAAQLRACAVPDLAGPLLVFVNGRFNAAASDLRSLPPQVHVTTLREAAEADDPLLAAHLARHAAFEDEAFTALNTAFMDDGAVIHVEKGAVLREPITLLNVAAPSDGPFMTHPRNLIVCDDRAEVSVVEHYVGSSALSVTNDVYLTNAVTELVVGRGGHVSHYLIEQESPQAFNVSTLAIEQQRDSRVASHTVLFGGALVRNNVHPVLAGEGCDCLVNGLFVGEGRQHLDNFMRVEHAAAHCDSRQFYNGVLGEHAHGVFSGRIYVAKDAQKTDAKQTSANLLLSEHAQIDTKPQLEIYADDVKCTHGATVGQINEDAVFYLRSRGIGPDAARAMVIYAFAAESLDRMEHEPIRAFLATCLLAKLPQGEFLKDIV